MFGEPIRIEFVARIDFVSMVSPMMYGVGGGVRHCCIGACMPTARACALWLFWLLLFSLLAPSFAVCPHCKGTIAGCPGGDGSGCPTVATVASNGEIFREGQVGAVPSLCALLPPDLASVFTRPVCEAIVGVALAPTAGTMVDFSTPAYRQATAVVQAANYGYCSVSEALSEINQRIQDASDALAVTKLRGALDVLNRADSVDLTGHNQGVYTFIWAKLSQWIGSAPGTVRLATGADTKVKAMTAVVKRPGGSYAFFELLHWFVLVVTSLGLASVSVVSRFIGDVVWGTIDKLKLEWKIAHELLLIYLREIETDAARALHFGNVFRRGGQDTFLAEAKQNALLFFRPGGGDPQPKGISPTGRFNTSSTQACAAFNNGKPCTRLDAQGTCLFNHRCNQFVSDKGKGGICFGEHARCQGCDYDAGKKLAAALK